MKSVNTMQNSNNGKQTEFSYKVHKKKKFKNISLIKFYLNDNESQTPFTMIVFIIENVFTIN